MNKIMLPLHAYMAGGGCMVNMFCEKPNFPYNKGINFIELSWWLLNIEKVPPTQSQLSIIIKPNQNYIKSDKIHMIIQELDTQDVHNRGHS